MQFGADHPPGVEHLWVQSTVDKKYGPTQKGVMLLPKGVCKKYIALKGRNIIAGGEALGAIR